jgi:hypothetical protein
MRKLKLYLSDIIPKSIIISCINLLVVYAVFLAIHPFDVDYLWSAFFLMVHPFLLFTGFLLGGFITFKYCSTQFYCEHTRVKRWFYFMLPCLLCTGGLLFALDYTMLYLLASQIGNYNNALQDYVISTGDLQQKVIASPLCRQDWQFVQKCIPFVLLLSVLLVRLRPRLSHNNN